jgi:hypothetical protein
MDVWSPNSTTGKRVTAMVIARSNPVPVSSYDELLERVTDCAYHNREYFPLYRGQSREYQTTKGKKGSSLLSAFYRAKEGAKNLPHVEKEKRKARLEEATTRFPDFIRNSLPKDKAQTADFCYTPELTWALFQHYEVVHTPLLDLTQSLPVALSFAHKKDAHDCPVVYMLGFEEIHSNIAYSWHGAYQLICLSSIMPGMAKRPLYQEGYFIGDFPIKRMFEQKNRTNFACRLLAKFSVDPDAKDFFPGGFQSPSHDTLLPSKDPMKDLLEEFKKSIEDK